MTPAICDACLGAPQPLVPLALPVACARCGERCPGVSWQRGESTMTSSLCEHCCAGAGGCAACGAAPGAAAGAVAAVELSVASFNVLAQVYTRSVLFPYATKAALRARTRIPRVLALLKALDADVLCLQEVDEIGAVQGALEGYEGLFTRRSNGKQDGCATFWRRDRFALMEHAVGELNALADNFEGEPDEAQRRLEFGKDNVCQMVRLRALRGGGEVVVGNVHTHWNPELPHVKLAQARFTLELLHEFSSAAGCSRVVLCGDFNSMPDSPVYELLAGGGGDPPSPLPLRSAYALRPEGEPDFTNFTQNFVGTLDYILVSPNGAVSQQRPIMTRAEAEAEVALPATFHPSDHVPLGCRVSFEG